jgi:uncharacterized protein YjiS (DUF1127 family)
MNTTFDNTVKLMQSASTRRVFGLFARQWDAFQARRQYARVRAALSDMSNRELRDIGIARGEIDYVASNPVIDPRRADPPIQRPS